MSSILEQPLLGRNNTNKKSKDIHKLTNVLNDENMLQLMERNLTSESSTSNKVLPSDRELNDLVSSTNLKNLRYIQNSNDTRTEIECTAVQSNKSSFIIKDFGELMDEEKVRDE